MTNFPRVLQVPTMLYLGGCLGVESQTVREQATLAARIAGAKYVIGLSGLKVH